MELTDDAFEESAQVYFDRCAGCHGTCRAGATGPDLDERQIAELAAFLQLEPPEAPSLPMDEIRASWTVNVPPEHRPDASVHGRNNEVWVSVWGTEGELVVYDAQALQELERIGGLETPTGKFNVFNTANDVY